MKVGPFDLPGYYFGDAVELLRELPDNSIHCCVTSPPYWGLRSYLAGDDPNKGLEIGAEATPWDYVDTMTAVFREVRRVLREDGTCWLNLGDTYAAGRGPQVSDSKRRGQAPKDAWNGSSKVPDGLKAKDLCLIPYRVAIALQKDGWWVRSNIVWEKANPMPESVSDRPTAAHESVFLLTKSGRYYYDSDAVREPDCGRASGNKSRVVAAAGERQRTNTHLGSSVPWEPGPGRNLRNVWSMATKPYKGSHYAAMPPALVEKCVKAGCPKGGIVMDPFLGSGTVAQVAEDHGRQWLGFDLDERNEQLIRERTSQTSLLRLAYNGEDHVGN
jgi:DNA modification methylase